MDPRIQIRIQIHPKMSWIRPKMSWIRNTARKPTIFRYCSLCSVFLPNCVLLVFDVTMVMRIQERKAQIARTAYFTVPIVSATVGWMGALEIAKKVTASPFSFFTIFRIGSAFFDAKKRRSFFALSGFEIRCCFRQ
jgi:hypothetical protein